jgi:hypothetical protein
MKRVGWILGGALMLLAGVVVFVFPSPRAHDSPPAARIEAVDERRFVLSGLVGGERASAFVDDDVVGEPPPAVVHASPETPREPKLGLADLVVVVASGEGFTVAGATVETWRTGWGASIEAVVTDARGEVLVHVAEGWKLVVRADGYVEAHRPLTSVPSSGRLEVVMSRGEVFLRARVVDERGEPVAGARVEVAGDGLQGAATSDEQGLVEIPCDALPDSPSVSAYVEVRHPDYCWLLSGLPIDLPIVPDQLRTIAVHRWASINFDVLDPDGQPLAGGHGQVIYSADLGLEDAARTQLPGAASVTVVRTDAPTPGAAILERVPPMLPIALVIRHPRFEPLEIELGRLAPAERRSVSCAFRAGMEARLFGLRVVDPAGAAVRRATAYWGWGEEHRGLRCDEDGSAEFVPPDEPWTLRVVAPGHASLRREFSNDVPEELEVVLQPSDRAVRVRVFDADGAPVSRVSLRIVEERPPNTGPGIETQARTDEVGLAVLSGIDEEVEYQVRLGLGNPGMYWWNDERPLVPSPAVFRRVRIDDMLEMTLVAPATIGGRIEARRPSDKSLRLTLIDPDHPAQRVAFTVGCTVGPDGEFLFTGLPPGRYAIWSEDFGSRDWERPLATVDLGAAEERRDLVIGG